MNIPKVAGYAIILAGITLGVTTLNHAVYSAPQEAALVPDTTAEANVISNTQTVTAVSPVSTPAPSSATSSKSTISKIISAIVATPTLPPTDPSRLSIPALNIDAHVQEVGINVKGNVGTPNNFTDVAWYKLGPAPGQTGTAVIDGHVDNGLALDGVFKHLEDIKVGDDVYITRQDGTKLHFQVIKVASYPYQDASQNALIFGKGQITESDLNLITCTGDWVAGDKTYDHRLVVFTKLVS